MDEFISVRFDADAGTQHSAKDKLVAPQDGPTPTFTVTLCGLRQHIPATIAG
jgi:hypothetical protein